VNWSFGRLFSPPWRLFHKLEIFKALGVDPPPPPLSLKVEGRDSIPLFPKKFRCFPFFSELRGDPPNLQPFFPPVEREDVVRYLSIERGKIPPPGQIPGYTIASLRFRMVIWRNTGRLLSPFSRLGCLPLGPPKYCLDRFGRPGFLNVGRLPVFPQTEFAGAFPKSDPET